MSFALFDKHLADLRQVFPDAAEIFVCPICLKIISREAIHKDRELVSLGHVWPDYMRDGSRGGAFSQSVLLCKTCNSKAGGLGDKAMQEHMKALAGERAVKVKLYPEFFGEPISLNWERFEFEELDEGGKGSYEMSMTQDKYKHNKQIQRFRELADSNQEIPFAIVEPFAGIDIQLAQLGCLTSAYLYAFHNFGYRYVFQAAVEPVREAILASFDKRHDGQLEIGSNAEHLEKAMGVWTHAAQFEQEYIGCKLERHGEVFLAHLEIYFLCYGVKLPIAFTDEFIESFNESSIQAEGARIYFPLIGKFAKDLGAWKLMMREAAYRMEGTSLLKAE